MNTHTPHPRGNPHSTLVLTERGLRATDHLVTARHTAEVAAVRRLVALDLDTTRLLLDEGRRHYVQGRRTVPAVRAAARVLFPGCQGSRGSRRSAYVLARDVLATADDTQAVTLMGAVDHTQEAERLADKSLNGDYYDEAFRLRLATLAQVHATLAQTEVIRAQTEAIMAAVAP
ncbi:MAG: hypothetical protein ACRDRO_03990 [Pseudonocardiaceae bacterium]